jgi:hypothetical protein
VKLDEVTSGLGPMGTDHYSGILARNACHFAPYTWYRWQTSHLIARDYARRYFMHKTEESRRLAWVYHGYADHFLQDSFAAGHLINKTLLMQWYVEWVSEANNARYRPVDWDIVKTMTTAMQPGLVGRRLYDRPWLQSVASNDPQTVQENRTVLQRIDASNRSNGNLEVFGIGTDNTLHHTELTPRGWMDWIPNPWGAPEDEVPRRHGRPPRQPGGLRRRHRRPHPPHRPVRHRLVRVLDHPLRQRSANAPLGLPRHGRSGQPGRLHHPGILSALK